MWRRRRAVLPPRGVPPTEWRDGELHRPTIRAEEKNMALIRAWLVLIVLWLACLGLVVWVRSLTRRQALAWFQVARWAVGGAVLALALAALTIYLF